MITTTIILINLKDDRWSEAETIEALREAGPVTFLDLQTGIVSVVFGVLEPGLHGGGRGVEGGGGRSHSPAGNTRLEVAMQE